MIALAYIALSAMMYRVPRGGPDREVWQTWLGFPGLGSFGGALIWAAFTALPALMVTWWAYPLAVGLLMLAEAPGWARFWPNDPSGDGHLSDPVGIHRAWAVSVSGRRDVHA